MSWMEVLGDWEVRRMSRGGLRRDLRVTVRDGSDPGPEVEVDVALRLDGRDMGFGSLGRMY
jgi:hypothetical protein